MPAIFTEGLQPKGKFTHVFNRGTSNREIFKDSQDYEVFLNYLCDYLSPTEDLNKFKKSFTIKGKTFQGNPHLPKNYFGKVEMVAYILRPTHFHLLIHQKEKGVLEKFIRSLSTRYAIYFNKKYKVKGALFAGPYKAVDLSSTIDLLQVSRYIHRNTDKKYEDSHSSYLDYLGLKQTPWVKSDAVLTHFENTKNDYYKGRNGYKNFVEVYTPEASSASVLERISEGDVPEILESQKLLVTNANPVNTKQIVYKESFHRYRIPEVAFFVGVYIILFIFGINNIKAFSKTNNSVSKQTPAVSGVQSVSSQESSSQSPETEVATLPDKENDSLTDTLVTTSSAILEKVLTDSPTITPTLSDSLIENTKEENNAGITESNSPIGTVIITITDGSNSVNIRQEPSLNSEKIAEANEGETFEYVSKVSGWNQIKLSNGTLGYVSPKYSKVVTQDNY